MYFQDPRTLLQIYAQLEEQNLFLIQNAQESEEALEELRAKFRCGSLSLLNGLILHTLPECLSVSVVYSDLSGLMCRGTKERMDGESEGLRRQVERLELIIQAEMEKGKVLQVALPMYHQLDACHTVCLAC